MGPVGAMVVLNETARTSIPAMALLPHVEDGTITQLEVFDAHFEQLCADRGLRPFFISAATGEGLKELAHAVTARLKEIPK